MYILLFSFLILLLLGIPIAFVLGLVSLIFLFVTDNVNVLNTLPSRMFTGTQSFGLLAIPLFILVGEIMNYGGITPRLVRFCTLLIGHIKGGLAYVNVAANTFLASIMGSANAQTAVMSRVMVPEMEKEGYDRDFSAGLTVSSSLMGPLIPPSMPFIIYGVTASVSISGLFLAGIIPGLILAVAFIVTINLLARKYNFPKSQQRSRAKEILLSLLMILPAMLIPAVIVFGIILGWFTPTESATIAAVIAFLIGFFYYRELKMSHIPKILINTAINSAIVTFLVATASIFGYVLTRERIPHIIGESIMAMTENPLIFLLLINVLLLFVGMIMEGIAAMIILVPILLPVAIAFGIDPIHFGIIIVMNLTIGLITPPVGTALFITSSVAKVSLEKLIVAVIPFLVVAFIILILITYVPSLSTWLPYLFR